MSSLRIVLLLLAAMPLSAAAQRPAPRPVAPRTPQAAPAPRPAPHPQEPRIWHWDHDVMADFDLNFDLNFEIDHDPMLFEFRSGTMTPIAPLAPLAPMEPLTPLAPMAPVIAFSRDAWEAWTPNGMSMLPTLGRQSGPDDSLYRRARETLNRGEYRQAAELLGSLAQKHPNSRHVSSALYWQAFALYRAGTDAELRRALEVLDEQQKRFSNRKDDDDVNALVTRVVATLASRGDSRAVTRVRERAAQGGPSCDQEDLSVRAEALGALVQSDPSSATTLLQRVLARRDECSAPLRRRAVYLIGRDGIGGGVSELTEVAKNDPDVSVRRDAIARLAQLPGGNPVPLLEQLLASTDESGQRAIVQSLRNIDGTEPNRVLRRLIEREDLATAVRVDAIRSLGRCCGQAQVQAARQAARQGGVTVAGRGSVVAINTNRSGSTLTDADVSFLRTVYDRSSEREIKTAILEAVAGSSSSSADQWIMGIVRNGNEDIRYRRSALSRLRRSDIPVEELGKLYDSLDERDLRSTMVSILGSREEPAATDKLIEIAKTGTDPSIRRMAINVLAKKNDPRTTRLLLELVER
ncbi:MAG: HEAT repeat domain-containing protein [Gemmatimonadales bacterium]